MYHLIKKDVIMQKRAIGFSLLFIFFFTFTLSEIGPSGLVVNILAVTYMLALGASAVEDKNNSDLMLVSLPIKKDTIVSSKYISVYIFAFYAVFVNYLIYLIVNQLNLPIKVLPFTSSGLFFSLVAVSLFCSITLPLIFKYGFLKSRVISFILFFVFIAGGSTLVDHLSKKEDSIFIQSISTLFHSSSDAQIALLLFIPVVIILFISYLISLNFYKHREF
ncbi:ABC-2 transporter permease [Robertmurraya sp. DFI.2.37]|uniref:ABC-2 transporter permease n=1 Tax=Robertmurraya sp. DFI.2.37 TaxID=3031819 RepID=UPI0012472146|nr:ABC-2 transporter permease [Robertmurraya sp. DFI.2.37]MDF1511352.1 ABC-2 transporter permease [Robertmurraya sp. DFI.2.37]